MNAPTRCSPGLIVHIVAARLRLQWKVWLWLDSGIGATKLYVFLLPIQNLTHLFQGEDGIQHKKKKERKRPGVKFHDLGKTYLKSVQSRPHPTRTVDDSDSSDDESDLSDDNSDADDDEDEPGPRTRGRRARVILPAENIKIDAPGINLSSPGLLAMITADGATSESPPTVTVSVALTPVFVESSRVDTTVDWAALGLSL
ncbi:hypothetical protein B0H10DRAFT_2125692 [Mycena sp. CBHHK59/15]|nr:hypothetical protein B0H10DRAFT_2125692 [Mycena sp. CBHHK59/15]